MSTISDLPYNWIYDALRDFKLGLLSEYEICQLLISRFEALKAQRKGRGKRE